MALLGITLRSEFSQAFRALSRSPRFSLLAVSTLSLGLAASITIFSVTNAVLIRPLAYAEPDRLFHIRGDSEAGRFAVSVPDYLDIAARVPELQETSIWQGWGVRLRDRAGVMTVESAARVSPGFFRLLRVEPVLGRFFDPAAGPGSDDSQLVISYSLWEQTFGRDPGILGRTLNFEDGSYTVIGVTPASFEDPVAATTWGTRPNVWGTASQVVRAGEADRTWLGFWGIARLAPESTLEAARSRLEVVSRQIRQEFPAPNPERQFSLISFREARVGGARATVLALLAAVLALLLIACSNVSHLLLSRGASRQRELALRSALGAGRARLVGLLLLESLILTASSAAIGLGLAHLASGTVLNFLGRALPRTGEVEIDLNVVIFTLLAALFSSLLAGALPALRVTGRRLSDSLRSGDRGGSAARDTQRLRGALIVFETAAAVVLLLVAGLLIKSVWKLQQQDLGLQREALLTVPVSLPDSLAENLSSTNQYLDSALRAVLQGGQAVEAGFVSSIPMSGIEDSTILIPRGRPLPPNPEEWRALVRAATPDYFSALGIERLAGRLFEAADHQFSQPVAIVNQALVDTILRGEEPLDRVINVRGIERRIVGVVKNVRHFGPQAAVRPALYEPYSQVAQSWMRSRATLVVRTRSSPADAAAGLRLALSRVDPDVSLGSVRSMEEVFGTLIAAPRLRAVLMGGFASAALILSAVGIAGLIAYSVTSRFREIAIRLALGAERGQVLRLFLREAATLNGVGLALGLALGAVMGRLISSFLFVVDPLDPGVVAISVGVLLAASLLASYLPARRALSVDPAQVLRG